MDIGNAQVAAVLAIHLFDEFFKALYRMGIIPAVTSSDQNTPFGRRNVTVRLQPPEFALGGPQNNLSTLLNLIGDVELRPEGISAGPADSTFPLNSWVQLNIELAPRPDAAPIGRFVYAGVVEAPTLPLTADMIDDFFMSPETQAMLNDVQLDLVTPIVASLEANLFPDDDPPARDSWPVALRLLRAANDRSVDALLIQVALPGDTADGGEARSRMPVLTEFGIIYSRQLLNTLLAAQAAAMVNREVDDAVITSLSLMMLGDVMLVNGRAARDPAVITFIGPVRMQLIRGSTQFAVDTHQIAVDVDLPWWLDFLLFLSQPVGGFFTFGLGPLIGHAILASEGTSLDEIEGSIAAAPFQVRGAITTALSDGLTALAAGLRFDTAIGTIQPESTPDRSHIENGNIAVFAQVFVNPLTADIVDGVYFRRQRRMGAFQLEGGRWLAAAELARLVKSGIITTPGYHGVEQQLFDGRIRRYMRANPDDEEHNNLRQRFGPV